MLLVAGAGALVMVPPAAGAGAVGLYRCTALQSDHWVDCQGEVPTNDATDPLGTPPVLLFGATTAPACGSVDLGDLFDPRAPALEGCVIFVNWLGGNATIPLPSLGAVLAGRL